MKCFIEIDGIQVDSKVFTTKFCCDYSKCKGGCCWRPLPNVELNGGALDDHEAAEILFHRRALSFLCDKENTDIVMQQPLNKDNKCFFTSLKDDKCVLCSLQKETCVLKIAKDKGITDVGVPLSCALYPLILETQSSCEKLIIDNLYEVYCIHGYRKGEKDNVFILDFLRVPLIQCFGEDFYNKLKDIQREYIL